MKRTKILPPTWFLVTLIAMLVSHYTFPLATVVPTYWNLFGLFPLLLGLTITLVANNTFQQVGTTVMPFQRSSTLVTDGIYRLSRNPMYLGFILALVGVAVLLGSLAPFGFIPVFALLLDHGFVDIEEKMLAETFGPAWQEYRAQVGRWL